MERQKSDPSRLDEKNYIGGSGGLDWGVLPVEDPTLVFDDENCCDCVSQTFTGGVVFCNEEDWNEVEIDINDDARIDAAAIVNGNRSAGTKPSM